MVNIKVSRVIKGDPQKLWELINRVDKLPEWMPGVTEARIVKKSKGTNGLGRQQVLKTDINPGKGETIQQVIAWEPPTKITWQHLKDVINGREFEHAREIKTTLSITNIHGEVTFRMVGSWKPAGISGRLMTLVMKRTVKQNFAEALRNLEKMIQPNDKRRVRKPSRTF